MEKAAVLGASSPDPGCRDLCHCAHAGISFLSPDPHLLLRTDQFSLLVDAAFW